MYLAYATTYSCLRPKISPPHRCSHLLGDVFLFYLRCCGLYHYRTSPIHARPRIDATPDLLSICHFSPQFTHAQYLRAPQLVLIAIRFNCYRRSRALRRSQYSHSCDQNLNGRHIHGQLATFYMPTAILVATCAPVFQQTAYFLSLHDLVNHGRPLLRYSCRDCISTDGIVLDYQRIATYSVAPSMNWFSNN